MMMSGWFLMTKQIRKLNRLKALIRVILAGYFSESFANTFVKEMAESDLGNSIMGKVRGTRNMPIAALQVLQSLVDEFIQVEDSARKSVNEKVEPFQEKMDLLSKALEYEMISKDDSQSPRKRLQARNVRRAITAELRMQLTNN